jgi:hypothetical protein
MMLGDQFSKIIRKAFNDRHKRISETAGERIKDQMLANVDRGLDFKGAKFTRYSNFTVKERARKGFQTRFVDFQRDMRRIREVAVRYVAKSAEIFWPAIRMGKKYSISQVFFFHQHGMGNNPERNILPKIESDIQDAIHNDIRKKIGAILDEPVK